MALERYPPCMSQRKRYAAWDGALVLLLPYCCPTSVAETENPSISSHFQAEREPTSAREALSCSLRVIIKAL
jgi:hypothetical protein